MSQQVSRQVALMTVLTTCMLTVVLLLAVGLGAETRTALAQAFPLIVICAAGLVFLLSDPVRPRS